MGQFCNRVRGILSQSHLTHLQGVYFGFFTIIFVNETNNQEQMKTYILRNLTVASAMLTLFLSGHKPSSAQSISKAWNPDRGTHYVNPVINYCPSWPQFFIKDGHFCEKHAILSQNRHV